MQLCAPPGQLKTTAEMVLSEFEKKLILSNVTVKTLTAMRNEFLSGNIKTLIFTDFANLYRRHGSVSSNIEGIIMDLVGDGFRKPAYSDQRIQAVPARCFVLGAMTFTFKETMESSWIDSGFYRRFIWCKYRIKNPELLDNALQAWRLANIEGDFSSKVPLTRQIKYNLDAGDQKLIRYTLRHENDIRQMLVLASKILVVLKWKLPREYTHLWEDFSESLRPDGAVIVLRERKG